GRKDQHASRWTPKRRCAGVSGSSPGKTSRPGPIRPKPDSPKAAAFTQRGGSGGVRLAVLDGQEVPAFRPHLDDLVVVSLAQDPLGLPARVVVAMQIHASFHRRVPAIVVD